MMMMTCSSAVSCSCVVLAGWMTNVLESPTLAAVRSINQCRSPSMHTRLTDVRCELEAVDEDLGCACAALDAKRQHGAEQILAEVLLGSLVRGM